MEIFVGSIDSMHFTYDFILEFQFRYQVNNTVDNCYVFILTQELFTHSVLCYVGYSVSCTLYK